LNILGLRLPDRSTLEHNGFPKIIQSVYLPAQSQEVTMKPPRILSPAGPGHTQEIAHIAGILKIKGSLPLRVANMTGWR